MTADRPSRKGPAKEQNVVLSRLQEIWTWLAAPLPELASDDSSDWYAGLAIDPHAFSNQLCQLQKALSPQEQARQDAAPRKPVESMAIEFGSESAA